MTGTEPQPGKTRRYRLSGPGSEEIEIAEAADDEAAEERARALSKARRVPVVIERQTIVDWDYVTEVDERP